MVDTSIIMQAANTPRIDLPGLLQRSAESAAAIEQIPLLKKRNELSVQVQEMGIDQQQQAQKIQEQERSRQNAMRKANVIYGYASQLKNIPMAQRRTFLTSIPDDVISDAGIDSESIQSMAIDDASINSAIMQLEPVIRQSQSQSATPAELTTFNALTEGLSEDEQEEAKRIRLGLGSKRKGVRQIDIGGVPHVLDLDTGKAVPLNVGGQSVTAEAIGESQGGIKSAVARRVEQAKDVEEFIAEAVPKLSAISSNIGTYDEVVQAIDNGASTGFVQSFLPNIQDASIDLDNLRTRLGLDVVSMGSFGALSEAELKIALDSALPTTKEPQKLKKWVQDKKAAQLKARDALEQTVSFLNEGNSLADLVKHSKEIRKAEKPSSETKKDQPKNLNGFKFMGFE